MARVTVEDCIRQVTNRFELVMLAAQRARRIGSGAALTIDRDNDKNPVVALREIADETISTEDLREELIQSKQRVIEMDDSDDVIEMMEGEEEWNSIVDQVAQEERKRALAEDESFEDMVEGDANNTDEEPSLEDLAGGAPE